MTHAAPLPLTLQLGSPAQTTRLAEAIAPLLDAGDGLLLSGPVGAGKSHFARSLIRWRMQRSGALEDVPSPTFTLVQSYPLADGEIWHADLYRLSDPDEVEELGLAAAFEEAICLVEWPDRLPDPPATALHLAFAPGTEPEARTVTIIGPDPWGNRLGSILAHAT